MRCINNLFGLLLLALPLAAQAGLPASSSVPGGVAVIPLGGDVKKDPAPEAWLGKHRVLVAPDHGEWYAVVNVPLDTKPGEQQLQVSTGRLPVAGVRCRPQGLPRAAHHAQE